MTLSTLSKTVKHLKFFFLIPIFFASQSMVNGQCTDMYIAGVMDGPLSGGTPKGVLFCANANIADISIYGFGSANNGGGSDGQEFAFPAGSLNAGDCFWVASESTEFNNWFGFSPCFTNGAASINGDDAIELFCNGTLIDILGEVDCDPNNSASTGCLTTPSWEYTDGWVTAADMVPSAIYDPADWTISGINVLDGQMTNATATTPFPIETQICPVQGCGVSNVTVTADGACSGDDASYTVCADVAGGSGDYDLVDVDNGNAILSLLTGQADGNICFNVTITGPTTSAGLNVDVVDNADASCISGSPVAVTIPACPITACIITNVTVTDDGLCAGDDATYTVCADVAAGSGNYDLVDTGNGNAVLAALSSQADGNICFTVTVTGPTTTATLSVDVLDNGDPSCISGTPATVNIPTCPVVGADVYISEISYNPCTAQGNDDVCEYVIITNAGSTVADISGYTISNGFGYTFPAGTTIPAGGTLSLGISDMCPGFTFDLFGGWTGNMNNTSETLELNDASGANIFTVTYDDATGADGDCESICSDAAGNTVACMSSLESGGMCPDLSVAAPPVVITNSTCPSGNSASGGVIDMPTAACPTNSFLEYSEDGTTWSQTLPTYLQNGPVQTIMTRCTCDDDPTLVSPSSSVMTSPGSCDDCGAFISTFPANGN